jgi:hypothetical protein
MDEMDLALQHRREQYHASLEKKNKPQVVENGVQDDGFVDLTQGYESDSEDNADEWQQSQGSSQDAIEVLNDESHEAVAAASILSSSQGSSSVEDEPLYVRCQRLHQAREAVMESRKRLIDSSQEKSSSDKNHTGEVIIIE